MFGRRNNTHDDTLYKELNLTKGASPSDIKKSYRKLALTHHPDKGGDVEKFKKIQAAYEVLSDPEKKEKYDRFGLQGLEENNVGFSGGEDIFSMFFGNNMHQNRSRRNRGPRKLKDTIHKIDVELVNFYKGKHLKFNINRKIIDGESKMCSACNGTGMITQVRQLGPGMIQQIQSTCEVCNGSGHSCTYKYKKELVEIDIEPGFSENQAIKLKEMGNEQPGCITGDIIIRFVQKPNNIFKRIGDDLYMTKKVSLSEALTGCEFEIKHLDDRILNAVINKDDILKPVNGKMPFRCIPDEGMPILNNPLRKGKLIINFNVEYPSNNFLDDSSRNELIKLLPSKINKINDLTNTKCELQPISNKYISDSLKFHKTDSNMNDEEEHVNECSQS